MGSISTVVPDRCSMLYLVILGKGPADLEDSMLAWSGKANYRIDIKAVSSDNPEIASTNSTALLRNYASMSGDNQPDEDVSRAVASEILAMLKAEVDQPDQPLARKILAEEDSCGLHQLIRNLRAFSVLH
ncbi:MAG: hypothetical protein AB1403_08550, partial [Candidatus Riflebacteria bacterium]